MSSKVNRCPSDREDADGQLVDLRVRAVETCCLEQNKESEPLSILFSSVNKAILSLDE